MISLAWSSMAMTSWRSTKPHREAIKRARAGKGPSIIECKTYRWRGHFEGDPTPYRPKSEVDAWMKKDPIPRFENTLKEMGVLTDADIDAIKKEIGEKVEAAVKFSEESAWPALCRNHG